MTPGRHWAWPTAWSYWRHGLPRRFGTLEQLTVRTPAGQRAETYAAALIAITADTAEERAFLDRMAAQLGLDAATRADIHAQLGIPPQQE